MPDAPDPALHALEQALEAERARSLAADQQLRDLTARELSIAREPHPPSGPPSPSMPVPTTGWTVDTAMVHILAMQRRDREMWEQHNRAEEKFAAERDRRLTEVAIEREKALKIKETADLAALGLAREIQTYKDEKANELRSQIESERGNYVSRLDLKGELATLTAQLRGEITSLAGDVKPLVAYVNAQSGRQQGIGLSTNVLVVVVTMLIAVATALIYVFTH